MYEKVNYRATGEHNSSTQTRVDLTNATQIQGHRSGRSAPCMIPKQPAHFGDAGSWEKCKEKQLKSRLGVSNHMPWR